jgi:hypothetical protein
MKIILLFLLSFSAYAVDWYVPSGAPFANSSIASAPIRGEYSSIGAAFNKLPPLSGYGNDFVVVDASGSRLDSISSAGVLSLIGAQPLSASLTSVSGVTPGAVGLSILADSTTAAAQTSIGISSFGQAALAATTTTGFLTATGQGTASLWNVGSSANNVLQLNSSGVLPGVLGLPSTQGSFKNLKITSTGLDPNISVTADSVVVKDATGIYTTVTGINKVDTVVCTPGTLDCLDTGSLAYNTWYYIWLVNSPTPALLFSTSSTSPTLPSGSATYGIARIGSFRTPNSSNYNPLGFLQIGRTVQYLVNTGGNVPNPVYLANASGTWPSEWGLVSITYATPVTASKIRLSVASTSASTYGAMIAPNSSYPLTVSGAPIYLSQASPISITAELILESTSIAICSKSSAIINVLGYEDNL